MMQMMMKMMRAHYLPRGRAFGAAFDELELTGFCKTIDWPALLPAT